MNRQTFKTVYSQARKAKRAARIEHNGRHWTVTRGDCQRLDSHGSYDRMPAANIAMALNSAGDSRRRLMLPRACYGLVSLAREWRQSLAA